MRHALLRLFVGVVVACLSDSAWAQSFEVVHRFSAGPNSPVGTLVAGPDGNFYGLTAGGGEYGGGTVFRVDASGAVTVLHGFRTQGTDGHSPLAGLVLASDGLLYGTTSGGGLVDSGTIFRISPAGEFEVVFSGFGDGDSPYAPASRLLQASDGWLYGTTSANPSIFRFHPGTLVFQVLFRFSSMQGGGRQPSALIQASDGQLYGAVRWGGAYNRGAVFRMDAGGNVSVVKHFESVPGQGGGVPIGALVQAPDGHLYGLCSAVMNGGSLLYRLSLAGEYSSFAVLGDVFNASTDPREAPALLAAPDGYLYAASSSAYVLSGNASLASGSVLRIGTNGAATPVYTFDEHTQFRSGLALGPDGHLYGVQSSPFSGSIYRVSTAGAFEQLSVFKFETGYSPLGALVRASDGRLYGTASEGGAYNLGTIFRLDAPGVVTVLHSFAPGEGGHPAAGLRQATLDGRLYGTTYGDQGTGCGTVFRVDLAGSFGTVHEFNCADGGYPRGPLLETDDLQLYGTTYLGGASGGGTIYRISAAGTFEVLYHFDGSSGSQPVGALIQASDGYIYGTTQGGGDFGLGTVFRMDLQGNHTALHHFGDAPDFASEPLGGLVQASDGHLYGTTSTGGTGGGLLYRLSLAGALEVVSQDFDGGYSPMGELIEGPDRLLYGTTNQSDPIDTVDPPVETGGTVFRVGAGGAVVTVKLFEYVMASNGSQEAFDGAAPAAGLTLGADHLFYGTTSNGGSEGNGTIFRLDLASETPAGTDVEVQPVDPTTGTAPVNLTFGEIAQTGTTTVLISSAPSAPPPPPDFVPAEPPTYVDVVTTATFAGVITVCFDYSNLTLANPSSASLLHYDGTVWVDVTTSRDLAAKRICGEVSSLSPFVVGNLQTNLITRAGFYEPINSDSGFVNTVKAGSTVPLKFEVFVNGTEKTDTSGLQFSVGLTPCSGGVEDAVDFVVTGGTSLRYDTASGQFVQNWKTPRSPGTCYTVRMTTADDGQSLGATFKLK